MHLLLVSKNRAQQDPDDPQSSKKRLLYNPTSTSTSMNGLRGRIAAGNVGGPKLEWVDIKYWIKGVLQTSMYLEFSRVYRVWF